MKFDQLLLHIGEFGPYQRRIYFLVCIPSIFAAFHKLIWVFLGAVPKHRCFVNEDAYVNGSLSYTLPNSNLSALIPWDKDNKELSRCERYVELGSNDSEKCSRWIYDDSQYVSTVVTDFDLVCSSNWMRALVYSLYVFGEFLGCTILSGLSDRIGRRKILLISLIGQGVCGILAGAIKNYYAFIVFRTLVGMFTQGLILVCYVLALEFVGPSKRAIAGIATNYFFGIGYVLISGSAYLFRQWQHLQIFLSVPPLLYAVAVWWVPESARWLISVNETEKAMKIIEKAAQVNAKTLPPLVLEKEDKDEEPSHKASDFFMSSSVIFRILIMCFAWFVNSATYYGLNLNISNLGGNDYLNFLISATLEFPAATICILSIQHFGRRLPLFFSMVLGGLALLSVIFVSSDSTALIVTFSMIGKLGITISYAIMYIFAAELYPTQIRNIAMGVNSTFARIGNMSTSFIVLLADYWRPIPFIILGSLALSSGILTLFLPETHRKALPESFLDASELIKKSTRTNGVSKTKYISAGGNTFESVELKDTKS